MRKGTVILAAVTGVIAAAILTACAADAGMSSRGAPEEGRREAVEERKKSQTAPDEQVPEVYQAFLEGGLSAAVADWYEPDSGYSGSDRIEPGKEYTLAQLTDIITLPAYTEWEQEYRGPVEYALFDSGGDGEKELAVRLHKVGIDGPDDSSSVTFILKEKDGILYLCDAFDNWSRGEGVQYYYGLREGGGSGGAGDHFYQLVFIDREGRKRQIYSCETLLAGWMTGLNEEAMQYYNEICDGGYAESIWQERYRIGGKEYCMFGIEYAGEESQGEKELFENLLSSYEEEDVRLVTFDEIEALMEERDKELGIRKEWYEKRELEWHGVGSSRPLLLLPCPGIRISRDSCQDTVSLPQPVQIRHPWLNCTCPGRPVRGLLCSKRNPKKC